MKGECKRKGQSKAHSRRILLYVLHVLVWQLSSFIVLLCLSIYFMAINEGAGGPKSGPDVVTSAEKGIDPAILAAVRVARDEVRLAQGKPLSATGDEALLSPSHQIVTRRFPAGSREYHEAVEMLAGMEKQYEAQIALYLEAKLLVKDAASDRLGCMTPEGEFQPVPLFAQIAQAMIQHHQLCVEKMSDGFTVLQLTPQSLPLSEVYKFAERFLGSKLGDFMIDDAGQFEKGSVSPMHPRGLACILAPQNSPVNQLWTVSLRRVIVGSSVPSSVAGAQTADGRAIVDGHEKAKLLADGEAFATLHDTTLAYMAELANATSTDGYYQVAISAGTVLDPQDAQGPSHPITMFAPEGTGEVPTPTLLTQSHFFANREPADMYVKVVPLLVPHGINHYTQAKAA